MALNFTLSSKLWTVLCASALLGACASPPFIPFGEQQTISKFDIAARKQLALTLLADKKYRESLIQWRILQTIDPNNKEYLSRIRVIGTLVNHRAEQFIETGIKSMREGKMLVARQQFYRAAALDPTRDDTYYYLRELEMQQVMNVQLANTKRIEKILKSESSQEPKEKKQSSRQENFYLEFGKNLFAKDDWEGSIREIKKYLAVNRTDEEGRDLISQAYYRLAETNERKKPEIAAAYYEQAKQYSPVIIQDLDERLHALKSSLADSYYNKGVRSFQSDLSEAISNWQQALLYDPDHANAKLKLNKALQMQKNLKEFVDSGS